MICTTIAAALFCGPELFDISPWDDEKKKVQTVNLTAFYQKQLRHWPILIGPLFRPCEPPTR